MRRTVRKREDTLVYASQENAFAEHLHGFGLITREVAAEHRRIPVIAKAEGRFEIRTPRLLELLMAGGIIQKGFDLTLLSLRVCHYPVLCCIIISHNLFTPRGHHAPQSISYLQNYLVPKGCSHSIPHRARLRQGKTSDTLTVGPLVACYRA